MKYVIFSILFLTSMNAFGDWSYNKSGKCAKASQATIDTLVNLSMYFVSQARVPRVISSGSNGEYSLAVYDGQDNKDAVILYADTKEGCEAGLKEYKRSNQ
jgi:hypothetical protein